MIRKILLLTLLVAAGAIATTAFSQSVPTTSSGSPSDKASPTAEKGSSAPGTTSSKPGEASTKPGEVPPVTSKTQSPAAPSSVVPSPTKADSTAKTPSSTKSDSARTTGKDSSTSKTIPTSSAYPSSASASSGRKDLVVEGSLVTLIYDNKVPASEAGMLTDVAVEEGSSVEKDALVAQIDIRSTLAKQKVAEAEMYAAQAQASNPAEIEVAEKAIEVSKADMDSIDEIRKRSRQAVSDTEWRKNWFQLKKAEAQLKQATNEKDIAGLTANAKKAQHEAASIELDLRQARAPFKGQVVEIMKKRGDWVTVGEPIMHIVGLDRVRVRGFILVSTGVSHDELIDKPVSIAVDTPGGRKHTVKGIIGFASPVVEGVGTSRQFRVWADVDNEMTIDPVTKRETWKIQPGSKAVMTIDMTPPKPATPARIEPGKTEPSKSGKGKVDAFKPVTGEAGKSETKKKAREF